MFRKSMSKKSSRRSFRAGASYTHQKNISGNPMRGGIRL